VNIPDFVSREQFLDVRLKLRLSQSMLAKIFHVSSLTISRWENGNLAVPRIAGLAILFLKEHYQPEKNSARIRGNRERKNQPGPVVAFSDPGAA
jgi:DNA-binding XRE family transcriptional regulator